MGRIRSLIYVGIGLGSSSVAAKKTRRRLALLSLPVVVGLGLFGIAKLAAWQRSDLVADLSAAMAHGETQQAINVVHQLIAMADPPIPALIAAAIADQREIAAAGQLAISRLLFRWEDQIESKQHVRSVAGQLSQLSQSLADNLSDFSDGDQSWLETTTRKILRLANTIPAPNAPLVALNCDAIFSAIGTGSPATTFRSAGVNRSGKRTITEQNKTRSISSSDTVESGNSDQANVEREPSGFVPPPDATVGVSNATTGGKADADSNLRPMPLSTSAANSSLDIDKQTASNQRDEQSAGTSTKHSDFDADDDSSEQLSSLNGSTRNSEWSKPIFRILPATPTNASPSKSEQTNQVATRYSREAHKCKFDVARRHGSDTTNLVRSIPASCCGSGLRRKMAILR